MVPVLPIHPNQARSYVYDMLIELWHDLGLSNSIQFQVSDHPYCDLYRMMDVNQRQALELDRYII